MAECVLIEAIPDKYKEWFEAAKADRESRGLDASTEVLEDIWTRHIVDKDTSGVMKYIADRGVKAAIMYNGSGPKETFVLGSKIKKDGEVTIATSNGTFTFKNGSVKSEPTVNGLVVTMPIMENILEYKDTVSGMNVGPIMGISQLTNRYASYMLVGAAEKSGSFLKPYIEKADKYARENSKLYSGTVGLLTDKFSDWELLKKLKASLYMTGDIDWVEVNKVINLGWESSRRTAEILDTELRKLDKMIQKAIKSEKDRDLIHTVFGTSGLASLMVNKKAMEVLMGEGSYEDLVAAVGMDSAKMEKAEKLKKYMVDRVVTDNIQNAGGDDKLVQMATVLALEGKGWEMVQYLRSSKPELFVELVRVAGFVRGTQEVVNGIRTENSVGSSSGKVYNGYDEHGLMDVYDGSYTREYVTEETLNQKLKDPRWTIIRKPEGNKVGIIQKESTGTFEEGAVGFNKNRIRNGVVLDTEFVTHNIAKYGNGWLNDNNVVYDSDNGYPVYRTMLTKDEYKKAKGMTNIAHSFYRSYTHNKEVIEADKGKELVIERLTANEGLMALEKRIIANKSREFARKRDIAPFLNSSMSYDEIQVKYPEVAKMYTPVKNISNYGSIGNNIKYVRKDMEDILVGFYNGSVFKDEMYNLQKIEKVYKQLVQMLKLKMVVANPAKLAMDAVSNTTLLLTLDVGIDEVWKRYPEAIQLSKEMSELEGLLVKAKLELAKDEASGLDVTKRQRTVRELEKRIDRHPFSYAIKNGFLQSQGTSMIIKEFDTISGLQKTIDDAVGYLMKDKDNNPTEIHNAIVWWMNAGFGLDDILNSVGNISKIKGTSFGKELVGIAERLNDKKQTEDTVRYVSEFIAAPSSELVRQGSRAMQMSDIMSRWTLYIHEVRKGLENEGFRVDGSSKEILHKAEALVNSGKLSKKKWEKIESNAGMKALRTFIDYRINLPKEIKQLSDYGILMFPSFWMRAQQIIWNMAKYHPVNTGAGVLVSDLLNLNGASIVNSNILTKMSQGTLLQPGQNVLDPKTIILGF